jgi:hypothetical protein
LNAVVGVHRKAALTRPCWCCAVALRESSTNKPTRGQQHFILHSAQENQNPLHFYDKAWRLNNNNLLETRITLPLTGLGMNVIQFLVKEFI